MASPTQKPRPRSPKTSDKPPPGTALSNESRDIIDPVWLAKALGIVLAAAFVCGYLTLCLLFYQGQWQLVLHPARSNSAPAALSGIPFQTIHFGVDESASPQLTGLLIPAEPAARYAAYTVLYLPSGDGSLADADAPLVALHETGINIFAFDYRGYGQSGPIHPNQARMTADADSAWQYLAVSRGVPPSRVVLFGNGVGCSLAARLAENHPEAPAVVLESPRPDLIQTVFADPRTKSLPVRTLFREDFPILQSVTNLKTPKLFLLEPQANNPSATPDSIKRLTSAAASPKMVSELLTNAVNGPIYKEQLTRFLDQYLK